MVGALAAPKVSFLSTGSTIVVSTQCCKGFCAAPVVSDLHAAGTTLLCGLPLVKFCIERQETLRPQHVAKAKPHDCVRLAGKTC